MFTPEKLCVESAMSKETLIRHLDKEFQDKVNSGWVTNFFENKITLSMSSYSEEGEALLYLKNEIESHYLGIGWVKVVIKTSEEQGERPGIIAITLYKKF